METRPSTAGSSGISDAATPPTRGPTPPRRGEPIEMGIPPMVSRRHRYVRSASYLRYQALTDAVPVILTSIYQSPLMIVVVPGRSHSVLPMLYPAHSPVIAWLPFLPHLTDTLCIPIIPTLSLLSLKLLHLIPVIPNTFTAILPRPITIRNRSLLPFLASQLITTFTIPVVLTARLPSRSGPPLRS